jgi:hypothetical protein
MPQPHTSLFMIGSGAVGACAGFALAFCAVMLLPTQSVGWSGLVSIFLLVACSMLGALAGAALSYRWVKQRGLKRWKDATWVGVGLGMVLGWSLQLLYTGLLDELNGYLLLAIIPIIAFGTLGGIAGTYITSIDRKIIPRPRMRRLGRRKARVSQASYE